jgi:CRP-like cAMP-binding protein
MTRQSDVLVRRLRMLGEVTKKDEQALGCLPFRPATIDKGHQIASDGELLNQSCLLIDGYTCRSKTRADGGRQILSIQIPGDIPDLQSFHLERMDDNLVALCRCEVAFFAHSDLRRVLQDSQALTGLLWRVTLVDAVASRVWITMLGRAPAEERMAHLFAEMYVRTGMAGLRRGISFFLPMTQSDLADCLGLSAVHANRTLQDLRRRGLVELERHEVTIPDWPRLESFAGFDPAYLHYRDETRTAA